ncbi:MAG: cation-translocating P-type ATPase [Thermaerobacter sp.]|nr:cation-translocating P-type ATPase [Thermaerobacter sp.]
MGNRWHGMKTEEVLVQLGTDSARGLSTAEVQARLARVGPNALAEASRVSMWALWAGQFRDFMVLVLLGATVISALLGEWGDAVTIVAIVLMNALLGFVQEYRAERSVESLRALTAPTARVIRDGQSGERHARELVPGDVIELEAGDRVPADSRLIAVMELETEEAALTGESAAVKKTVGEIADPMAPVGDRTNMVFLGTTVSRGRGRAIVVETGMRTEMGTIAHLIHEAVEGETPLQRRLEHMGKILVGISLVIVGGVVGIGLLRGEPLYQMFLTGVTLAVAAIPEGLPAIVTIALAMGVQRMIQAHAIVRRLPAVETLGATTVICSDKTGTLTRNQMTVTEIWLAGVRRQRRAHGSGFRAPGQSHAPDDGGDVTHLLTGAILCNNARLQCEQTSRLSADHGDPTELALLRAAVDQGLKLHDVRAAFDRVGEMPFESERQRMAVQVRSHRNQTVVYVKGAADIVAGLCRYAQWHGKVVPIDDGMRHMILQANDEMAEDALRVLAVAYRPLSRPTSTAHWEEDLIFLGMTGMIDPPREEAIAAVREAKRAGIRTVMITGDHPATARAIARQFGMVAHAGQVITGRELDALDDRELASRVETIRVYARVSPRHKLRVVRAWKARGDVVAMTGDGVNDAPAVKEADIGIAMGMTGTDVTKEASAMILTDDNFATIVRAIQEGRAIYDNIRKFIRYLLSCNIGEVLVMLLAVFWGMPLPLLPIQILFVNLVTDGLPAMALGVDPATPGLMERPPRSPRESIFAHGLGTKIAFRGVLIGVSTLLVFGWALGPLALGTRAARTMALATLVMSQLLHVFDARAEDRSFLEVGLFSNRWAVWAVLSSVAMLWVIVYVPGLQNMFRTSPLSAPQWAVVLGASGFVQLLSAIRELLLKPVRRVWGLVR